MNPQNPESSERPPAKKSEFMNDFTSGIISSVILLLILEFFLRFAPTPFLGEFQNESFNRKIKSSNPTTAKTKDYGVWNKPNSEAVVRRREYVMHVKINSKGLRNPETPYEKPAGLKRILCLGDSFTYGTGVEQSETFVSRLGQGLGGKVEVINAGAPGTSTAQQFLFFKSEGMKYQPDLVLLFFFQNDIDDNYQYALRELNQSKEKPSGFGPFFYKALGKISGWIEQALYGRSALYAGVTCFKRNCLLPYKISDEEFSATEKWLEDFRRLCEKENIAFGIVYIPRREELRKLDQPYMTDAYLDHYASAHGIGFLNLSHELRLRRDFLSYYFPLDTHLSTKGHEVVAELAAQFVKKEYASVISS